MKENINTTFSEEEIKRLSTLIGKKSSPCTTMSLLWVIYQFKKSASDAKIKYMHYKLIINMLIFFGEKKVLQNYILLRVPKQILLYLPLLQSNM